MRHQNSITREIKKLVRHQNSITREIKKLVRHQNSITREVKKLVCHQNSITREQNLITRQLLIAHASSTIPLKSRRADVEASGLIVRRKGVDMLPIASSVKDRKVRIRAKVQLPNHYPAWWWVTMVQKPVTGYILHMVLLH